MTQIVTTKSGTERSPFSSVISISCVAFICFIVMAGLTPFGAPKNHVEWVLNGNGLQFNRHSSIVSTTVFRDRSANNMPASIEIWLTPKSLGSTNAILSFDRFQHRGGAFVVRQYKDALVVRQPYSSHGIAGYNWLAVAKAFKSEKVVFVTITSGKHGTSIYLDGALAESFTSRGDSGNNLNGWLVVGNSADVNDSWPGEIHGLAVYGSELTSKMVAEHYASWREKGEPSIVSDQAPVALYLFTEGKGNIVHNQFKGAPDLIIPRYYFLLHPRFLSSVRQDYRGNWQYWEDVAVNVLGFVPLGFFVAAYFSEVRTVKYAAAATIAVGLLLSFSIECLQVLLPTRSSGSTDLITNTLGAAIGVVVYHCGFIQRLLTGFQSSKWRLLKPTNPSLIVISGPTRRSSDENSLSA